MKKKEDHLEKEMAEVLLQNKRLAEPLQRARDEVSELQRKLAHYEKDKAILAVSSRALGLAQAFRRLVGRWVGGGGDPMPATRATVALFQGV